MGGELGVWSLIVEYSLEDVAADADGCLVCVLVIHIVDTTHADAPEHRRRAHLRREAPHCLESPYHIIFISRRGGKIMKADAFDDEYRGIIQPSEILLLLLPSFHCR